MRSIARQLHEDSIKQDKYHPPRNDRDGESTHEDAIDFDEGRRWPVQCAMYRKTD